MFGLVFALVVLIICVTALCAMYMYYCAENNVKMFETPKYEERIKALEKAVLKLQSKQKENK